MPENFESDTGSMSVTQPRINKDYELTHRKIMTKLRKDNDRSSDRFDGWVEANTMEVFDLVRTPRWYPGPAGVTVQYLKFSWEDCPDVTVSVFKNGVSVWSEVFTTQERPFDARLNIGLGENDYMYVQFEGTCQYPSVQLGWYYGYGSVTLKEPSAC
jgi:hypothetical protein